MYNYTVKIQWRRPHWIFGYRKSLFGRSGFRSSPSLSLSGISASFAALRLVFKAFLFVELLLTGGEHEFLAAILANQCLVFHLQSPIPVDSGKISGYNKINNNPFEQECKILFLNFFNYLSPVPKGSAYG